MTCKLCGYIHADLGNGCPVVGENQSIGVAQPMQDSFLDALALKLSVSSPHDYRAWAEVHRAIRALASQPSPAATVETKQEPENERWVVGKNGWDASDEATREDI